jgi:superfamily II DNA or RNA helicase/HKD family nuclease
VDTGLYESLLTARLNAELAQRPDLVSDTSAVDDAEQPLAIVRHLSPIIERKLRIAGSAEARAELLRNILNVLGDDPDQVLHQDDPAEIRRLDALSPDALGVLHPQRPATPLSDAALMTNARNEPTLAAELRAELASADRVDLLCAFVKWHGLRLLERELADLRTRGVPLRVITTTYLGATDARALDSLVNDFGAEVRVNYEIERTRLHAKAWLLRRNSGFHTAYVGSSNLSQAALVDGLEWNVRLSAISTPHLLEKFRITFDSYWVNREFDPYEPSRDGEKLRAALEVASGKKQRDPLAVTLSGLEVTAKPYQAELLEQLDAERVLHNRHHNLIVAATGTGKTVVAALDYRRLIREVHGRDLSLLFIAHRKEILQQSRRMYQEVLADPTFGELLVDGHQPSRWRHVFASIQSLTTDRLSAIEPGHFDIVVVDEFHHAHAASYQRLLDHVEPTELLGLTATPERGDGIDVREFFGGRVAAELRLWDALEQNLLCPFHYFGIHDGTDLETLQWRRGKYDETELSQLYTGNAARTHVILSQLRDKVGDTGTMRALGFCVGVEHAEYMTEQFVAAGIPAQMVSGDTPTHERRAALSALRNREISALFTVDLFNEGLDIPEIDTVLFLRPTESATVFLQQLGRGLRLTTGKTVLTALDFVGHQRKEFRFDHRFRALTGLGRKQLEKQVKEGFPFLPSGSQIVLDEVARELVLENVRQQIAPKKSVLISEVRAHPNDQLASYLEHSGRSIEDILRPDRSWTSLSRDAGKLGIAPGPREQELLKRVKALAHVDDRQRWEVYSRLLSQGDVGNSVTEQKLASMLYYSLFPDGGGFNDAANALAALHDEVVAEEMRQVVDIAFDAAHRKTIRVGDLISDLADIPLALHASYSREEILAGLGWVSQKRTPSTMREGVARCAAINADAFLITLRKSDADYSPTTMYRDHALSQELFHWESQSTIASSSPTGQRYINHSSRGSHILLFVREARTNALGAAPYIFLGPATYVTHDGDRPMAITWQLHRAMPAEMYLAARAAVA